MSTLRFINENLQAAIEHLEEATAEIKGLPLDSQKEHVHSIAKAFSNIVMAQLSVYELQPDLRPVDDHDVTPDGDLTAEQSILVDNLSPETLVEIDRVILSHIKTKWRKVALVVALTMNDFEDSSLELPDVFFSKRVAVLVELGQLKSQGDLRYMRYSEVRFK